MWLAVLGQLYFLLPFFVFLLIYLFKFIYSWCFCCDSITCFRNIWRSTKINILVLKLLFSLLDQYFLPTSKSFTWCKYIVELSVLFAILTYFYDVLDGHTCILPWYVYNKIEQLQLEFNQESNWQISDLCYHEDTESGFSCFSLSRRFIGCWTSLFILEDSVLTILTILLTIDSIVFPNIMLFFFNG